MSNKNAELKCPDCGEQDIREWKDVPTSSVIESVLVNDEGRVLDVYTGVAEPHWDMSVVVEYVCEDCLCDGNIEDFIVKEK